MTKTNTNNSFSKGVVLWSGALISLALANLIQYLLNPESSWWSFYIDAKWTEVTATIVGGILMYAIIFVMVRLFTYWANKKRILGNHMLMHIVITTIAVIGCMFLLLYLENIVYAWIWPEPTPLNQEVELGIRQYLVVNTMVAAFVNSFYNTYFFFEKWKMKVLESNQLEIHAHQLKQNALQAELEVLKLQLDPHFLFNNFSVLTQLIDTSPNGAQQFLSNLSRVYRYILTTAKRDMVALEDELKFVDMYFHLLKIRHGDTIHLNVNIDFEDKRKGIPPVTLQLLIENAIKHNISTAEQPLKIDINSVGDGKIVVKNNLQRINIEYKNTGMGLQNIQERYQLLLGQQAVVRFATEALLFFPI